MALSRRSQRINSSVWPGFVDAMTGLLLVLMFVLTIFMVIQFVLRETISGQATELDDLAGQIASLTDALGLERGRTAALTETNDAQSARIASLVSERDATAAALTQAQNQITGFEAQVAGLLAQRADLTTRVEGLVQSNTDLLSQQDQLNLALASARDEIDASVEAARLAAARREALQAMVADLQGKTAEQGERISDLEAAKLVDAAAAEALRAKLENADSELTAMTLSLEAQRAKAEETLTLLAAAQAARDDLQTNLAAALLAQQQAEQALSGTQTLSDELAAALAAQQEAEARADDATARSASLEDRLAEAVLARDALRTQVEGLTQAATDGADLQTRLAAALAARAEADSKADRQAALLATANKALSEEQAQSAEARRQTALLNEQVAALRQQVGTLQSLLNVANDDSADAQVQIEQLGAQLNTALAKVAAEERRRRTLEEAERQRLEAETARLAAEAQNLERFRSDFFGQLRGVVEGLDGVRIEGDRFVFSSEVLFPAGEATLSPQGRAEIAKVAAILRQIADQIPPNIDWIIRVDGHTDNLPLSGTGRYADNWELSQARALSVVKYMEMLGIPPNRMSANGFAEFQPINPADTPEARAQNRRIELKLTER